MNGLLPIFLLMEKECAWYNKSTARESLAFSGTAKNAVTGGWANRPAEAFERRRMNEQGFESSLSREGHSK